MSIRPVLFGAAACLPLFACGDVGDTRYSSVTTLGETYTVRTRTVTQGDRTYETSSVQVGPYWFPCIVDSPGDCEKVAQTTYDSFDPR